MAKDKNDKDELKLIIDQPEQQDTPQPPTAAVTDDAVAAEKGKTDAANHAESANEEKKETLKEQTIAAEAKLTEKIKEIKENVHEDDPKSQQGLSLRMILGGDLLSGQWLRSQIWLIVLIVVCITVSVAVRYQCQQDMLVIDKLTNELKDAKIRALSSSSTLTEKCRKSHVLEILKQNRDSLLHVADQPPYIINVPE